MLRPQSGFLPSAPRCRSATGPTSAVGLLRGDELGAGVYGINSFPRHQLLLTYSWQRPLDRMDEEACHEPSRSRTRHPGPLPQPADAGSQASGRLVARPRRFDRIIKIGYPDLTTRTRYLAHKFRGDPSFDAEHWGRQTDGFSFAALAELALSVLCLKYSPPEAVERVRSLMEATPSSKEFEGGGPMGFGRSAHSNGRGG
jgi:hypothetical protein